jgi:methylthioribose-1-phosphate isomerase
MSISSGDDIPTEQRPPEEIVQMWFKKRMAPENVNIYNPAFDVVDNALIAGIITEYGIARPPYNRSLQEIFDKKAKNAGIF